MFSGLAKATSRFMQAVLPSGPMMYSSADMPSTAPWADYWYQSMGLPNAQGILGGDEAYAYVSACYAATRLLSGIGSKMPLNRVRKADTPDGPTSFVMRNDPIHRLLNYKANPEQTSMSFRSMLVMWQVNRGTAFAEIQRDINTKRPIALWPIHPNRCKWFRSADDGTLWWHVRNNQGFDTDIPDVDMLRIPYTILDNSGLRGVGVADRAVQTIQLGQNLDRAENDASMSGVPRIVVESPRQMAMPEQDAFRRQWREMYTQSTGENVALLVGGATAKPLSWSATDTDHVKRREFNIEDVARWYDVPVTLLRRAIKESAGNVEQLGQEFQTYSLSFLELWEQEAASKLLNDDDRDDGQVFELDYKSLLRADHTGRAAYHSAMVPIGGESPNEVRAAEGRNPYPEGKGWFVQGALRPIDEPYKSTGPQDSPQDPKNGKADPLKIPKKKLAAKEAALRDGAKAMLEDCIRRVTHKEAVAANRAAKKPSEWFKWVEEFYADHEPWLVTELQKPLQVCKLFEIDEQPAQLAKQIVDDAKSDLIDAADGPPDEFSARVEALTEQWESNRPGQVWLNLKKETVAC
jgi:HK97 family phage portal protein